MHWFLSAFGFFLILGCASNPPREGIIDAERSKVREAIIDVIDELNIDTNEYVRVDSSDSTNTIWLLDKDFNAEINLLDVGRSTKYTSQFLIKDSVVQENHDRFFLNCVGQEILFKKGEIQPIENKKKSVGGYFSRYFISEAWASHYVNKNNPFISKESGQYFLGSSIFWDILIYSVVGYQIFSGQELSAILATPLIIKIGIPLFSLALVPFGDDKLFQILTSPIVWRVKYLNMHNKYSGIKYRYDLMD